MAITRSKVTKDQVFKDKEPIKKKFTIDLWRGAEIKTIFYQNNTRDARKKPARKYESKGESTMEYRLGKITKD
jgi:hypothetical protein